MLTSSLIKKYGIAATYDSYTAVDELFSGRDNDPINSAENWAHDVAEGCFWDVTVGVCPNGKCVTQIIVFRNRLGYELYKNDGIVIFDDKEI